MRLRSRSPKRVLTPERRSGHEDWERNRKGRGKKGNRGAVAHCIPALQMVARYASHGNNKGQRCRFKCGRVHCCQICFGNHRAHSCRADKKRDQKDSKDFIPQRGPSPYGEGTDFRRGQSHHEKVLEIPVSKRSQVSP